MIDFHCHILPGLDDGAATLDESLEMAQILSASGFTRVCCTSHHMRGAWNVSSEKIVDAMKSLQQEIDQAGIALQLLAGREYYLDEFLLADLNQTLLLPGGRILVEFPSRGASDHVRTILYQIVRRKIVPLIAHPERTPLLTSALPRKSGLIAKISGLFTPQQSSSANAPATGSLLSYLQEIGCGFQGNLGSFAGIYGDQVKNNAIALLKSGIYTHLGSDAHSPSNLAAIIAQGRNLVHSLVGDEYSGKLFGSGLTH